MYSAADFNTAWFALAGLFVAGFGTFHIHVFFTKFRKCFLLSAVRPGNITESSARRIRSLLKYAVNKVFEELATGALQFLMATVFFILAFIRFLPK